MRAARWHAGRAGTRAAGGPRRGGSRGHRAGVRGSRRCAPDLEPPRCRPAPRRLARRGGRRAARLCRGPELALPGPRHRAAQRGAPGAASVATRPADDGRDGRSGACPVTLLNLLLTPTPPTASDKFSPQASTDGRLPLALAELPPGSRLEATVLGRDGSGRPLLRTVYGTLAVVSDLPLPRGTRLVLDVRPEATRLLAKIVSVNRSPVDTALAASALRPPSVAGPASATAAPLPATGRPAIAPTEPGPATAGNPAQAAPPSAPNVPLSAMAARPAALPGTAAPVPDRVLPGAIAASPGTAPA